MNCENVVLGDLVKVQMAKTRQKVIAQKTFVEPPGPFVGLCEGKIPFGHEFGEGWDLP